MRVTGFAQREHVLRMVARCIDGCSLHTACLRRHFAVLDPSQIACCNDKNRLLILPIPA